MASSNRKLRRKQTYKSGVSLWNVLKRMSTILLDNPVIKLIWPFFLLAYVTLPFWCKPLQDSFDERLAFGLFSILYVPAAFMIALISVVVWIFDKLSASIMMFLACNGMIILIPIMGWLERYLGG